MERNEGIVDRIIRILVGLALFAYAYINLASSLQIVSYVVAAILVFTGISGFCLIYKMFNFSTAGNLESDRSDEKVEDNGEDKESSEGDELS